MSSPRRGLTRDRQYSVQIRDWIRDWKTGGTADFGFKNASNAKKIDLKDLNGIDERLDHGEFGGGR